MGLRTVRRYLGALRARPRGGYPLVCFGIDPRIASPTSLCRTRSIRTRSIRQRSGAGLTAQIRFESWTMLHVYPQIITLPKDIGHTLDKQLKIVNGSQIEKLIDGRQLTLLDLRGGLIKSRPRLHILLASVDR